MPKIEQQHASSEQGGLWTRRQFLKLSVFAAASAGAASFTSEQAAKANTITSPERSNPFSKMSSDTKNNTEISGGAGVRWPNSEQAPAATSREVSASEVEKEILRTMTQLPGHESSASLESSGGVITKAQAERAAKEQSAGIAAFLSELSRNPSAVLWTGSFQEGSQNGLMLNPLSDKKTGEVLYLLKTQAMRNGKLETSVILPNYAEKYAKQKDGFSWLPAAAIDSSGSGRFIPVNADPSKYQFRVERVGEGWNIYRDQLGPGNLIVKTELFDDVTHSLVEKKLGVSGTAQISEMTQWTPEQVRAFVKNVVPLKWTDEKNIPWGITKTSTPLNGDEYVLNGIFQGYGEEDVSAVSKSGKKYSAKLAFLQLVVPDEQQKHLLPVKFYLYQNMKTTGILGYNFVDAKQFRLRKERGGSASANPIPLLMNNLDQIPFGASVGILSPPASIVYTESDYASYFPMRPEAVVAFVKNGTENASFKSAMSAIKKGRPAEVFAAEWMYLSTTPPLH